MYFREISFKNLSHECKQFCLSYSCIASDYAAVRLIRPGFIWVSFFDGAVKILPGDWVKGCETISDRTSLLSPHGWVYGVSHTPSPIRPSLQSNTLTQMVKRGVMTQFSFQITYGGIRTNHNRFDTSHFGKINRLICSNPLRVSTVMCTTGMNP